MKTYKLVLYTVSSLILTTSALALVPSANIVKPLNENMLKTAVCTALENKIDAKLKNYDENKLKHNEVYTKLVDRLTQKIADWKALGYDTDQITKDLNTLKDKIKTFNSDYAIFISKLETTQNYSCGTGTDFKNALNAAKDALKQVRADVTAIRQYYWSTIRPDIMKLKQQTPVAQ